MELADLQPFDDVLTLIVMGPGFGESVLVRWPPDHWLVVDSFRRMRRSVETRPVVEVLDLFDARPAAVALTHPHDDHSAGFASLIARRREGGLVGWLALPQGPVRWDTQNPEEANRKGATEHAIAAIDDVWTEYPGSRWNLHAGGPPVEIGGARIEVLSPTDAALAGATSATRPNDVSSAMLLTWEGSRVLLGADLTNVGWADIEATHGPLSFADTTAIKVAHHGSAPAQHPVALGVPPARDRLSIGTPFNKGRKVPIFADGGDVELLLRRSSRLYLSTHHGPLPQDCATRDVVRRSVTTPTRRLGSLTIELDAPTPALLSCWAAASFAADGGIVSIARGLASMCVVE